jgi:hypothetical protein
MARTCKLCSQPFEVEVCRQGGRPREYCLTCQPEGWKIVLLPHRTKLRRLTPLTPRMPKSSGAKLYRVTP